MEKITGGGCENRDSSTYFKDYNKLYDQTDIFYKKLDSLKEIIQTRGDIFNQKKEKYQVLMDFQMKKIEKEEEHYFKRSEEITNKIGENRAQLKELNQCFSQLKEKHNNEKRLNEALKEKIEKLQSDSEQEETKFNETLKNYAQIVIWYEDFLNLALDMEENTKIISVYFKNFGYDMGCPHVVVKNLNPDRFEVVGIYHSIDDARITKYLSKAEFMMLLSKVHQHILKFNAST